MVMSCSCAGTRHGIAFCFDDGFIPRTDAEVQYVIAILAMVLWRWRGEVDSLVAVVQRREVQRRWIVIIRQLHGEEHVNGLWKKTESLHMTYGKRYENMWRHTLSSSAVKGLDAFAFTSHIPPSCGYCKQQGTTTIVSGTSRAECRAGPVLGGGDLKLITLFNKWPTSPVLVLFSLTFLCLFDLSLTAMCTGACGIGVLSAVQCDRNDERVLSAIHCNRHLWDGRDEERRWMTRNWFVSADCVCQSWVHAWTCPTWTASYCQGTWNWSHALRFISRIFSRGTKGLSFWNTLQLPSKHISCPLYTSHLQSTCTVSCCLDKVFWNCSGSKLSRNVL